MSICQTQAQGSFRQWKSLKRPMTPLSRESFLLQSDSSCTQITQDSSRVS